MSQSASTPTGTGPSLRPRSVGFWFLIIFIPFLLFFAVLGVISTLQRWPNLPWLPPKVNLEMERAGTAPWTPQERRADLKRRIEVIDRSIPLIQGEMKYLDGALQRETALGSPEARDRVEFMRREMQFLIERIAELHSDRDYYVHHLRDMSSAEKH